MDNGKDCGTDDSEYCHCFRRSANGRSPLLSKQEKDCSGKFDDAGDILSCSVKGQGKTNISAYSAVHIPFQW